MQTAHQPRQPQSTKIKSKQSKSLHCNTDFSERRNQNLSKFSVSQSPLHRKMEGMVARALKSSLRRELAVIKSTQQTFYEELLCLNANNGVPCEEFSVDDLLDFTNGELPVDNGHNNGQDNEEEEKDSSSASFSSQDHVEDDNNSNTSGFSCTNDSDSIFASGLAVPTDDIAELEWVSHFVDDSVPELPLLYPTITSEPTKNTNSASFIGKRRPDVPVARPALPRGLSFSSPVPVKPRSKRQIPNGSRVWISGSSSQTDSSSCSSGISSSPCLVWNRVSEPPVKKQKRKSESETDGSNPGGGSQFQRRCSHCQVQKTPQWRAGPLGAKTLCNACGVRYKSGRLFPEYRPACSPTFSSEVHSNSHRKVLEMRKRKELTGPEPDLVQANMQRMVPSC